ncbi:HAD-IA family hydrolase [Candidatus Woesearchaeota archaeon]|nr:HAD-IA family hydrolase [Candidatus Woesearchaeota archaeon]
MTIKAVFFDFDLTLVDTKPGVKASYKALSKLTDKKPTKKGFRKYVGSRFSEMIERLHKESDISKKKLIQTYLKAYRSKIPKMKYHGKKIIPMIKDKKIIILTNNYKKAVKAVCRYFNIKYDKLITDQDMKKYQKKHDAMIKTLKRLDLKKSEAVYVGDHINDVKEAHKAGIKSVIVPTGVYKRSYLKKFHPDFLLPSLKKFPKIIK